jgi:predicted ATPase
MKKMSARNNWCTITGAPSSGKTTIISLLKQRGYHIVPESARIILDERVASGMSVAEARGTEEEFQERIFQHKLLLHDEQAPETLSFFDRGMHDILAYILYYSYPRDARIDMAMENISYRHVFLLEPLPDFTPDYGRMEGPNFGDAITPLLYKAYDSYGMQPIMVPVLPAEERVDFILSHIEQNKLASAS